MFFDSSPAKGRLGGDCIIYTPSSPNPSSGRPRHSRMTWQEGNILSYPLGKGNLAVPRTIQLVTLEIGN